MTYKEAEKSAYSRPWTTQICPTGHECWCRMIVPCEPIFYSDDLNGMKKSYIIVGSGEMNEKNAEYFVMLHNSMLDYVIINN